MIIELKKTHLSDFTADELMETAHRIISQNDMPQALQFKKLLLSEGTSALYAMDEKCFQTFIDDMSMSNLDKLNDLRAFYGLQTKITPFEPIEANERSVQRIKFSGMLSVSGQENEHYDYQHSPAFLSYKPDFGHSHHYNLEQNPSIQKLMNEGLKIPLAKIEQALRKAHIPEKNVNDFNIADFCHIFIESEGLQIDPQKGCMLKLNRFTGKKAPSFCRRYWKKLASCDEFMQLYSQILQSYHIPPQDIEKLRINALENGTPCFNKSGRREVASISPQLHHLWAIKDGGRNVPHNMCAVMHKFADLNQPSDSEVNTHTPLHRSDSPCFTLYSNDKGLLALQPFENAHRVQLYSFPVAPGLKSHEQVMAYMGADNSQQIIGSLANPQSIRTAEFNPFEIRKNQDYRPFVAYKKSKAYA